MTKYITLTDRPHAWTSGPTVRSHLSRGEAEEYAASTRSGRWGQEGFTRVLIAEVVEDYA